MIIDRWIRRLLPRTDAFLDLFIQDIENISAASRVLRELLDADTDADRVRLVQAVEDLEHRGDEITHQVFRQLSLTFITTLDREDIGALAAALDDILDNIDRAATSIRLYRIAKFDEHVRDLAEIIERSVAELSRAIPLLRDLKEQEKIRNSCVRVNAYENEADKVFHRALGQLFHEEKDPISLIKQKELLAVLESATDRCEDAAVLIESILVKQG